VGAAGSGAAGVAGCMPEVSAGRTWAAGKTVYLEDCKRKEKEKKRKEKKRNKKKEIRQGAFIVWPSGVSGETTVY